MKPKETTDANSYRGPDGRNVQRMFAGIAHRYDFLNHFLSISIDKQWRRLAVKKVKELIGSRDRSEPVCLDLCAGTGDLAIELHRRLGVQVVASDFCHPMLVRSLSKVGERAFSAAIRHVEADALKLPFADEAFDAAANAFGLRNLEDPGAGLSEMLRVLKPGGAAVVLEFSKPAAPVIRHAFNFYFRNVLPWLGAAISGQGSAYRYLPDSVRKFPSQDELAGMMHAAGFGNVNYTNLSGGIAALHWGIRDPR